MRKKREELLDDVIRAFLEFHERSLWERFSNDHCFVVEVPGEKEFLLASVMGAAGEEYGLMILRGQEAVNHLNDMQSNQNFGDDTSYQLDLLTIGFEAFDLLPPEFKALYWKAGIHPKHGEQVPYIIIKPPGRVARTPHKTELELLLKVLKTIVAADRKKLLKPTRLDDRDGICVVTSENIEEEAVFVSRKQFQSRPIQQSDVDCSLSFEDLAGIGLIKETWLIGVAFMPARIKGDDRAVSILLIVEKASGLVLDGRPFFADQMQEAISIMVEAFHGSKLTNRRKGIPKKIIFSSRTLHDATAPALRKAKVKCKYKSSIPGLEKVKAEMMDQFVKAGPGMESISGRKEKAAIGDKERIPAPGDLAGWKEADSYICSLYEDFFLNGDRLHSTRAVKRYFGDPDIEYYLKEYEKLGVAIAYTSWGILDYRPTRKGVTQAEKIIAKGLPPAPSMLLRARMESHPSIYRVAGNDPKAGTVNLEDVLLGEAVTVHDTLLSQNLSNTVFLSCRVYAAGKFYFIEMVGPPLNALMGLEAVEFLRECDIEFTRDGLRRDANAFGWLWDWFGQWKANWRPPHITNTDGDEMLWHTASFAAVDQDAICRILCKRRDIEYDNIEDEFVWVRDISKNKKVAGDFITLGRISFVGDELVLIVNSAKRLKKGRKWLEKLPGIKFRSVTTRSMDEPLENIPMDERIAKPQPIKYTEEIATAMQEMMDKHYMDWIDYPVPALGGITPRQACRTSEGRQEVTMMIRTMADPAGDTKVRIPRQRMLCALGLETISEEAEFPFAQPPYSENEDTLLTGRDKVGRNDPCPCGSGKKYKKCCGR